MTKQPVELAYEAPPLGVDLAAYRDAIVIYVNGAKVSVPPAESDVLLLDFLRQRGLTGAKLGCGEGGCGACTVVVSRLDVSTGQPRHTSVNACLMPLLAADGCDVTTIEGIGSTRTGLHPVQQRMAELHAAQCGFCTPGIVMAMYALFLNNPKASVELIEEAMDGNLCRCTGYRPIWDAAKSLCADAERVPAEEAATCAGCPHKDAKGPDGRCSHHVHAANGDIEGDGPGGKNGHGSAHCSVHGSVRPTVSTSANKLAQPNAALPYHETPAATTDAQRALLPAELSAPLPPLRVAAGRVVWWRPTTLADALALKAAYPRARVVVGNTEVGIEARFRGLNPEVVLATQDVPELRDAALTDGDLVLGASTPLNSIAALCEEHAHGSAVCEAAAQMLRWFASNQIRNVACLGGNLATASPISDMNPLVRPFRSLSPQFSRLKRAQPPCPLGLPALLRFLAAFEASYCTRAAARTLRVAAPRLASAARGGPLACPAERPFPFPASSRPRPLRRPAGLRPSARPDSPLRHSSRPRARRSRSGRPRAAGATCPSPPSSRSTARST